MSDPHVEQERWCPRCQMVTVWTNVADHGVVLSCDLRFVRDDDGVLRPAQGCGYRTGDEIEQHEYDRLVERERGMDPPAARSWQYV